MPWSTRSAVLFLIFNRPDTTAQVLEQIRLARPARLYVAADGPRPDRTGEADQCRAARALIDRVDWPCRVSTLFRDDNLGCRDAISGAITWFFSQEEEGIILEDDCLPNNDFFRFCDTLLERHRHDPRIRHITGCNLQHGQRRGEATYYYSNNTHIWGWATWRRVWADYDSRLSGCDPEAAECVIRQTYGEPLIGRRWRELVELIKAGRLTTWDYQLGLANLLHGGLAIIPNHNLVSNLGFGSASTHTRDGNDPNAALPLDGLGAEITAPARMAADLDADLYTLNRDFNLEHMRAEAVREARLTRRIGRWVKARRRAIKRRIISWFSSSS